ncbi:MAG: hypothetical protein ABSH04_01980 [Acidimicrobiales bacterium]|jgi:hypothetical protein
MNPSLHLLVDRDPVAERDGPDACDKLCIVAWPDPVIDTLGHDPRSWYVEHFWLAVIGPTSTWLMRRLAAGLDAEPDGFDLPLYDTARALGLGGRSGRHSPFQRAVTRCITFELARFEGTDILAVRRKVPTLPRRHLLRLPRSLQHMHESWSDSQRGTPSLDGIRKRSRRIALGLLEIGVDRQDAEAQLLRWRIHPALAHEATEWASALCRNADQGEDNRARRSSPGRGATEPPPAGTVS